MSNTDYLVFNKPEMNKRNVYFEKSFIVRTKEFGTIISSDNQCRQRFQKNEGNLSISDSLGLLVFKPSEP